MSSNQQQSTESWLERVLDRLIDNAIGGDVVEEDKEILLEELWELVTRYIYDNARSSDLANLAFSEPTERPRDHSDLKYITDTIFNQSRPLIFFGPRLSHIANTSSSARKARTSSTIYEHSREIKSR